MKWFYRIFTWWHGQTLNTALYTLLFGKFVGVDEFGNRYYRSRKIDKTLGIERRWVIFSGENEGSMTPPGWYGWLHHTLDSPPEPLGDDGRPRRPYSIALVAWFVGTVATGASATCLWLRIPTVHRLRGYFWQPIEKPLQLPIVLALPIVTAVVVALVTDRVRSRLRIAASIAALVAFGFLLQHLLAFAEGRGIDGMRDRILTTGHAEFARTANARTSIVDLVRMYPTLTESPDQKFAASKPPGQLAFYILMADFAEKMPWLDRLGTGFALGERHGRLVNFAAIFFPLLSMLVLIPMVALARRLGFADRALWPALLYVFCPAVELVTLHLDQVLYPLIAVTTWLCVANGASEPRAERRALWWAMVGLAAWLQLFISFSLAPALLFAPFVAWSASVRDRGGARQIVAGAALALASFAASQAVAHVWLHYDLSETWARCMANHRAWKQWDDSYRWPAARLDVVEFAYWTGFALIALVLFGCGAELREARRRRQAPTFLAVGTVTMLTATAVYGNTISEVARLWLFMLPSVALVATSGLCEIDSRRRTWPLWATAGVQLAWMLTLKARQDFW